MFIDNLNGIYVLCGFSSLSHVVFYPPINVQINKLTIISSVIVQTFYAR